MQGKYKGAEGTDVGTYTSVLREGGVIYGKGQGIVTTRDRHEMATWTGRGIGRFTGSGKSASEVHCSFKHLQRLKKEENYHFSII